MFRLKGLNLSLSSNTKITFRYSGTLSSNNHSLFVSSDRPALTTYDKNERAEISSKSIINSIPPSNKPFILCCHDM